jgi:hypothetical protein
MRKHEQSPERCGDSGEARCQLSVKVFGEGHPVNATAMLEEATALRSLRHKKLARDLEKHAKGWLRENFTNSRSVHTVSLRELTAGARR